MHDSKIQSLDPVWPFFPEQKVLQIEVSKEFQEQQGFHSSAASREALLTVLDYRFKLMSFNRQELGLSHEELGVTLKALLAKDLDKAVYLLYGFGLKAEAYLRMPGLEKAIRYWTNISLPKNGNNRLLINWVAPRLPHALPSHTGKVIKMPYVGYGYGLHVWIGKDQRLPVVPASGRKQEYIVPDNPHMDICVLVPTGNRQQKRRQRKTSS